VVPASRISSTSSISDELARETAQRRESENKAQAMRRNLQVAGRERATEYGRELFQQNAERVGDALDALFGRLLRKQCAAGPHYCALPALLVFKDKGPRPIASIALGAVIDRISQRRPYRELALAIGREIEDEVRAMKIQAKDRDLLRVLKKRSGGRRKEVVGKWTMELLHLGQEAWATQDRFHVGGLLLDLVVEHTGLVRVVQQARTRQVVEPAPEVLALIKANPPRPIPVRRLPMLVEPRPWQGLHGGGHLDNSSALVVARRPLDLAPYEKADLSLQLRVINALQQQAMVIDPWMVEQQRAAWDSNIRGLFPVQRDPLVVPPEPEMDAGKEAWIEYRRRRVEAWADENANRAARIRIEEALRQCESIAGRPSWFAYELDFRGRIYSSNRYATHQGPDHEKALISFEQGEPCGERGFEWLLMAAAGHYGLGKAKWADRLDWGKQNLERLTAIAEEPLERLELWRGADDPWQLLQVARAVRQWLADPTTPIGCPVRLDQTCSGVGIAAALLRDKRLARHTNLIGSTRGDIYQAVADRVVRLLREEVELAGGTIAKNAIFWLDFGIDRSLTKGPVMTSIYGATHQTLMDGLIAAVEQRNGQADLWRLQGDVLAPVRHMAKVMRQALQEEVAPCLALQDWLRELSRRVVSKKKPIEWTGPTGWPMHLGEELPGTIASGAALASLPRQRSRREQRPAGELSARATNRGITANAIHSFDAAVCHSIISTADAHGAQILTNHDCFAVVPERAEWLHGELHRQLREMFKVDWLELMAAEIASTAKVRKMRRAPYTGDLCPGQVGSNPYCFS
jgi:DNA-directed RNA polymerase